MEDVNNNVVRREIQVHVSLDLFYIVHMVSKTRSEPTLIWDKFENYSNVIFLPKCLNSRHCPHSRPADLPEFKTATVSF